MGAPPRKSPNLTPGSGVGKELPRALQSSQARRVTTLMIRTYPNWKIYSKDARNAQVWFDGYCRLADSGIRLLNERDRLRAQVRRLRRRLKESDMTPSDTKRDER